MLCRERAESVSESQSCFDYDRDEILLQISKLNVTSQRAVPKRLRRRLLDLSGCPVLGGHAGRARIYHTLRREYYWLQMSNDVFSTLRNFQSCDWLWGANFKHDKLMKLFAATERLLCVRKNLLRSLKKAASANTFILVIATRFTETTRCNQLRNTTAAAATAAFLKYCISAFGTVYYILADYKKQFCSQGLYILKQSTRLQKLPYRSLPPPDKGEGRAVQEYSCAATRILCTVPPNVFRPVLAVACIFLQHASSPNNEDYIF